MIKAAASAARLSLAESVILVIDDNDAVRTALDILLSLHGARVLGAASPLEGLEILGQEPVDLVVQDMNFRREATSGEEGVQLFHEIRKRHDNVPIILLTAWTHLETAIDLVKAGAADYIAKPWDDARLLTTVRNLLDLRRARAESSRLQAQRRQARRGLAERFDLRGAIYESEAMHTLVTMATQVAHADVPVLITGPNGAGKEVLADIIQANSAVRSGPYLKVNLGALPQDLIEAELFGTEAGAFTGARARVGRFEAANGGTLFLDELGNLAPAGQAKLLRVLQTGELERLGSNVTRRTQVRMVAATNTDLRAAIRDGRFREDLYYRLNVIELELPPLSRRREDILPLARHFLAAGRELSPDAERALVRHSWPGNVRELQNVIRRACLLCATPAIAADALALPAAEQSDLTGESAVDRASIESALQRSGGVVAHAARDLGLSRQALYRRMEKLGIKTD
ncbi:MAG TPA: sigma-54 dependent transcriptional regulator [Steroidobacteraceae bacterium]|jgi:DNA-binding NtrC family response regulator